MELFREMDGMNPNENGNYFLHFKKSAIFHAVETNGKLLWLVDTVQLIFDKLREFFNLMQRLLNSTLRQVLFDLRAGNSNLAKSLGEKVTMQCTKMKTHTDACYPCKINKTSNFFPILVTSIHITDSFRL